MPDERPTYHDDAESEHHEARRRRRLRSRRIVLFTALAALLVGLWFGAPRASHAIKSWQSRRLARSSNELLEQGKFQEAADKARDAVQLRPGDPEAWRPVARLLTQSGQSSGSLEWWQRLEKFGRLTPKDRRDYAAAALASGDVAAASAQVTVLLTDPAPTALDHILAGQVAVRQGNGVRALEQAQLALRHTEAQPNELLAAAILELSITRRDSPPYAEGWGQITKLARDPANPMSLEALVFLARQDSIAPGPVEATGSPAPAPAETTPAAAFLAPNDLAAALENHPNARAFHQLLALTVRARQEPARADEFAAQAMDRFAKGDDETVEALAAWFQQRGKFDAVLQLLPAERALQSRALFLRHIDALAGLERWGDIRQLLSSERFPLEPLSQHMYLAAAAKKMGEVAAERNEWQRAVEVADTPEKLMTLGGFAETNKASEVADAAYENAIKLSPRLRAAHAARFRLALAMGLTARAESVAAELLKIWPEDESVRAARSYLRLLLGAEGEELAAIERDAQAAVAQQPGNWNALATLALARLRQNRAAEAVEPFKSVRATGAEPPGALAVRAAVLAATGFVDGAKNDARNLKTATLLPEERALIAPLMGD